MAGERRVPTTMLPAAEAIQSFAEVAVGYTRAQAREEAGRAAGADLAAAIAACPFGVDVPALVRASAAGDFDAALGAVLQAHPWPGTLGRWCHKYCEADQALGAGIDPLNISALERAAAEYGDRARFPFQPGPPTGRRVAIVGAGSASSAAAWRLRQQGHAVAVWDRLPVPGGMTYVGYPDFRLPRAVVLQENAFADWGVALHLGVEMDAALLERLLTEHDAALVGTGKFREVPMHIPGEELQGVWSALEFLVQFKLGRAPAIGRHVVVVGAGYTAQDASRTCRRLGSTVEILYRRAKEEMPVRPAARERYLARQEAEGAPFTFQVDVVRILGANGRVSGVECVRTEPGPPDADGRPAPLRVPGSEHLRPCDTVIEATGEVVDLSYLPADVRLKDHQHVWIDAATGMTSRRGLFAAGEMTGLAGTAKAFASGLRAAECIDRFLRT